MAPLVNLVANKIFDCFYEVELTLIHALYTAMDDTHMFFYRSRDALAKIRRDV